MDLPRLMFIKEECGDLRVVVDDGELTRTNSRKKSPEVLQAYKCKLCDKCCRQD